jgi:hypothetical protein
LLALQAGAGGGGGGGGLTTGGDRSTLRKPVMFGRVKLNVSTIAPKLETELTESTNVNNARLLSKKLIRL